MNWRNIPHPNYGNWGGANNTHSLKGKKVPPIDIMDSYFRKHDRLLSQAQHETQKLRADEILVRDLKKVECPSLRYRIYGCLYKHGCILIFSLSILVRK